MYHIRSVKTKNKGDKTGILVQFRRKITCPFHKALQKVTRRNLVRITGIRFRENISPSIKGFVGLFNRLSCSACS